MFVPVKVSNGVTLAYVNAERSDPHHCAFPASEAEFDAGYARIGSPGIRFHAGPQHQRPGEIGYLRGGRSAYFDDPPAQDRDQHSALARRRHHAAGSRETAQGRHAQHIFYRWHATIAAVSAV